MPSELTKSTIFGYRELSEKPSESELAEYYENSNDEQDFHPVGFNSADNMELSTMA